MARTIRPLDSTPQGMLSILQQTPIQAEHTSLQYQGSMICSDLFNKQVDICQEKRDQELLSLMEQGASREQISRATILIDKKVQETLKYSREITEGIVRKVAQRRSSLPPPSPTHMD